MVIGGSNGNCEAMGVADVIQETAKDVEMKELIENIRNGKAFSEEPWPSTLSEYNRVKTDLNEKDGIVLYKKRIVVPRALREKALETLHSAHQGCSTMWSRASQAVWWPKLNQQLEEKRLACDECTRTAPSQSHMPPVPPPKPDYPMQQICSDIAHHGGRSYIVIVDRYTNWASVYPADGADGLIRALRYHFVTYGAAEELASDGGPEYMATETQEPSRLCGLFWGRG